MCSGFVTVIQHLGAVVSRGRSYSTFCYQIRTYRLLGSGSASLLLASDNVSDRVSCLCLVFGMA
jgi:hypothetical protein